MTEPNTTTSPDSSQQQTFDIELPMCFYLGREYDLQRKKLLEQPVMYDAKDLTTHGVVVGMTGSGKTGLCISLLEEAAIDGIPCIIIDPKGDLTNLLLQFPELDAKDFEKWVNPGEAKQKKKTPQEFAEQLAGVWRKGLSNSLQTPERIKLLQESSEWRVYTPGSEAGLPLSVLKTFAAPEGNVLREQLNQRIDATATALLGLTGTAADPVQSREHILIAQLLLHSWSRGKSLDLPELISQIQFPPLNKIGAFDVETFYSEKDRLKLAIALNNILAAPSFSTWINGEPLDLTQMMYTLEGKPRQVSFYFAHLDETLRQFLVTLLLEEVLNWTRKQPGTTTLRALLYFDEVFGYLPPHPGNPPTKLPLMTMLKQARAFGVGVLLATQNPVDIDYKALSNAGTWFVGKLQTERDKARLIEGLEGVAAEQGALSNRNYLETVISSLGSRVFLLHNVHRGQPTLFKTRHTLSFLSGPMTKGQVAQLMAPVKEKMGTEKSAIKSQEKEALSCQQCQAEAKPEWKFCPFCGSGLTATSRMADEAFKHGLQAAAQKKEKTNSLAQSPPEVHEEIPQFYVPLLSPARPADSVLVYKPRLLAVAEVIFTDRKLDLYHPLRYRLLVEAPAEGQNVSWHTAERLTSTAAGVAVTPAYWEEVPESLQSPKNLKSLERSLTDYLYADARITLYENKKLDVQGRPGEDIWAFQSRCRLEAEKNAAREIAEAKSKYLPRFAQLGAKFPEGTTSQSQNDSSFFGFLNPLSWVSSKPKTPANDKAARLEAEWFAKQTSILEHWKHIGEAYDDILIKPLKKNIQVLELSLAWTPFWQVETTRGVEKIAGYR